MSTLRSIATGFLIGSLAFSPWIPCLESARAEPIVQDVVLVETGGIEPDESPADAIINANTESQQYLFGVEAQDADFLFLDGEPTSIGSFSGYCANGTFTFKAVITEPVPINSANLSPSDAQFLANCTLSTRAVVGSLEANGLSLWGSGITSTSNALGTENTILLLFACELLVDGSLFSAESRTPSSPVYGPQPPGEPSPGDVALCRAKKKACEDNYHIGIQGCIGGMVWKFGLGMLLCVPSIGISAWACLCCGVGCPALKVALGLCAPAAVALLVEAMTRAATQSAELAACIDLAKKSPECHGITGIWEH
jgi:hypothetical protein